MNDTFGLAAMQAQLIPEEMLVLRVYDDATGKLIGPGSTVRGNPTIGVGRNLSGVGMSRAECMTVLANDIASHAAALDEKLPWWRDLSPVRQRQMLDLCFNMGLAGLMGFPLFLAAMHTGDWTGAAAELRSSKWWREVGTRGPRIVERILAG